MKPIFRWTIGCNSLRRGFDVLDMSIKKAIGIYGDSFEWMICHNGEDPEKTEMVLSISSKYGVKTMKQKWDDSPMNDILPETAYNFDNPQDSTGSTWKLCPPRIDIRRHEIIMDNDIVLEKRLHEIDEFLASEKTMITQGAGRFYGRYDSMIEKGGCYNSGLIGLPPGFDFKKKLNDAWSISKNKRMTYADEQGLVSHVLTGVDHILVRTSSIVTLHAHGFFWCNLSEGNKRIEKYNSRIWKTIGRCKGFHFVGANRRCDHPGWDIFNEFKTVHMPI